MSTRTIAAIVTCAAFLSMSAACSSHNAGTATAPAASPSSTSSAKTPRASAGQAPSSPSSPAATEFNPPGDIPDSTVFVPFTLAGVHIRVPEGWARKSVHGQAIFTDHYNSIALRVSTASSAPTVAAVKRSEVPQLKSSVSKFQLKQVTAATRAGQHVVEVVYLLDSAPDQVTGKVVRDIAYRFDFFRQGKEAVLTLTGPRNADNVDPWRLVSNSLRWQ